CSSDLGRQPGLAAPYLFLLGSNAEYKNRGYGMKVFRELKASGELPDLRLVVAGQPIPEAVRTLAGEAASEVDEIVDPSNAEVAELHRHAAGLFWPSTHEGFGLPILEALAYGAPVFTLDRRPMTEVAGPAGFTFHDSDPAAAARDIIRAWPERSSRMIQAPDQVSRFSTEAMVEGYRSLYRRLA
ncbi:MAG: glycosyltransferase, partial [Fimbriimonadaceae bacterium]|nr:glycosyltransferase [Fimbriimonadaceae bacterium]